MATLLYRLGRFSYRRAWTVVGVWMLLLIGILGGGIALGGQTEESFAIPGTESQEALDRLEAVFPSVAGAAAQVVLVAPDGDSIADFDDEIEQQVDEIERIDGVDSVVSPFSEYAGNAVSDDDSTALIRVQFEGPSTDVTPEMLEDLTATASIGEDAGLRVEFGGQVFQDNTFGITVTEGLGVLFAGVVLVITFGALRPAGLPLLGALVGVGIVMGLITGVSAFTTVSSSAPLLALMIGLAVGIDYALFILSRHRTALAQGEDPEESAAMAVGTAGSAVVFAGLTVIIALLGLLVVGIPFLSVMGVGAAVAVLIAIAVATTLLPALLGISKGKLAPKVGSRAHRRAVGGPDEKPTMGLRWVRGVMKVPVLASLGVIAILGTLAIPALSLDLNLPDGGSEPSGSTQREAYELVTESFGPGYNGPLIVAVDITQTVDILEDLDAIGDKLRALDDVAYVAQGFPDEGLDTAIIQVVPESAPDSIETKQLVENIRDIAPAIAERYDTPISVTGSTAVGIDISNRLTNALVPFGIIVVGLSIVLLMMVFRSVLVPIKAALGFLLSVVASFGVVVAIFQWGWFADLLHVENPGPILSFMPILLMAVLFGLAMDYEVFLVTGMREEFVKTGDPREAIEQGFAHGARVVTAAALIMFFVFFAFVPEGSGTIKPIALGLAVGIAFDAFLVRMTLIPALMTLLGKAAWWMPRWLSRVLPNVDIEGEELREHRIAVEWAATHTADVITAEDLIVGSAAPLSLSIPSGSTHLIPVTGADRSLLAATIAGRLDPTGGRLQVAGHPLPSESVAVRQRVATATIGAVERTETSVTVGELLLERLELTQPVFRAWRSSKRAGSWLDRVNEAIARERATAVPVTASSVIAGLPRLERSVALAALAIAEATPVVVLDQDEPLEPADQAAFMRIIRDVASPTPTIVVFTTPTPSDGTDRQLLSVSKGDLS